MRAINKVVFGTMSIKNKENSLKVLDYALENFKCFIFLPNINRLIKYQKFLKKKKN